ncbi:uncharacterized protein LOC108206678 [Daucus carota subsp. sativus]|uniref:uncharacterized protein LOC108206678 n=1 Tax=Daucus carota subsp. sativus TaxID=79200 RepID=UPI0007EEF6E8|nr:PREDICTED: uncharacterized protein LOC108206678 [Daucus carota subsp. sativus]
MENQGDEAWDDTLLIKAFDKAISTFKAMHGKEGQKSTSTGGEDVGSEEQDTAALVSGSNEVPRDLETNVSTVSSKLETKGAVNLPQENISLLGKDGQSLQHEDGQNLHNGYSNTQYTEDYNHLLSQYYEVEEQRQKILNQLYQYGSWDYGGYDSSMQWGTNSASQEHQVPAQASCPTDTVVQRDRTSASQDNQVLKPQPQSSAAAHPCCSCICPCMLGPCTSLPACTSGTCAGEFGHNTSALSYNANSSSIGKDDLVNTALGAADRALSALKFKASGDANTSKDEEMKLETDIGKSAQSCSSKTDLSVVFNAWYSAGFYTCKYLMEQSAAKERQS